MIGMHTRGVVVAAVAATTAATVVTVVLHTRTAGSPMADGVTDWWLTGVTMGTVYTLTGAAVRLRRPDLPVGGVLLAIGLAAALAMGALEYGVLGLVGPSGPGAASAFWVGNWLWAVAMVAVLAVLPHLLPEGRAPSGRQRRPLIVGLVSTLAVAVLWMTTPYEAISTVVATRAQNPFGVEQGLFSGALLGVVVLGPVVALGSVGLRWHRGRGEPRQQLKWVLVGVVASLLLFAAGFSLGPVATAVAMTPLPVAIVLAVLRLGLWDVDTVLARGLTWLGFSCTLVMVYVGVLYGMARLLGDGSPAGWSGVAAAAVAVVLAPPVHRAIRSEVNLRVHGSLEDPATALSALGRRLEDHPVGGESAQSLLIAAMSSLTARLGLEGVRLRLADGGSVQSGNQGGLAHDIPLGHAARDVGVLQLPLPLSELDRGQRRHLTRLLPRLATAAHGALLERMLERATGDIAGARQEERRMLHRELHDGLGPALAAMALKTEIARDLVVSDPGRARDILDGMVPQLARTVADVRSTVLGLHPSALDELGLEAALQELVEAFSGPRQQVHLGGHLHALSRLTAGAEVAAYRIVAEALTNAQRHADASTVQVKVGGSHDLVEVTITDDGTGIAADREPGVGLTSMAHRAKEAGGRLDIFPSPAGRGTCVRAVLPGVGG
jgi:signal transduction histidine kinase